MKRKTALGLLLGVGVALLLFGLSLWVGGGIYGTLWDLGDATDPSVIVGLEWQSAGTSFIWPGVVLIGLYWHSLVVVPYAKD